MSNNTYYHYNNIIHQYVDCLTDINNTNKNINKKDIFEVHRYVYLNYELNIQASLNRIKIIQLIYVMLSRSFHISYLNR